LKLSFRKQGPKYNGIENICFFKLVSGLDTNYLTIERYGYYGAILPYVDIIVPRETKLRYVWMWKLGIVFNSTQIAGWKLQCQVIHCLQTLHLWELIIFPWNMATRFKEKHFPSATPFINMNYPDLFIKFLSAEAYVLRLYFSPNIFSWTLYEVYINYKSN